MLSSFIFVVYERVISSALTCLIQKGLLLCISILVWYETEDAFECVDNSLVLLLEVNTDLLLEISTSMFIPMLTIYKRVIV